MKEVKESSGENQSEVLSRSLRPKRLSQFLGQDTIVRALKKQSERRFPNTIILHGSSGCGKTTLARIIAISLQCTHQEEWGEPCNDCAGEYCVSGYTDFNIHEINAADDKGVDEVRELARLSRFRPQSPSKKRVIILDESHLLTSQAQNLLLKPTEEPPKSTVWIFCTTLPTKLLPTLRGRGVSYQLKGLTLEAREKLVARAIKRSGETKDSAPLLEVLDEMSIVAPRQVLMALEKYLAGFSAKESVDGVGLERIDTFRLNKAVIASDWPTASNLLRSLQPDDCRYVRAAVAGWLRACLLNERVPSKRNAISLSILDLTSPVPFEDGLLHGWLCATLYQVCRRLYTK